MLLIGTKSFACEPVHINEAASKDFSLKWIRSIDHEQPFLRLFNIFVARLFLNECITTCWLGWSGSLH
jgi:hypothetical protein